MIKSSTNINHAEIALRGRDVWAATWEKAWTEAGQAAARAENRGEARKSWTMVIVAARDNPPADMRDAPSRKAWAEAWIAALMAAEVLLEDESALKTENHKIILPRAWANEWEAAWAKALTAAETVLKTRDMVDIPTAGQKVLLHEWEVAWKEAGDAAWLAAIKAIKETLDGRWNASKPVMTDTKGRANRSLAGREAGSDVWKKVYRAMISNESAG